VSADGELLVGAVIVVGLVGIVLPVIPGSIIVAAAITLWAYATGGTAAWLVLSIAVALLVVAGIAKWLVAERHLRDAGVARSSMVIGGLSAIVGFFVIPVIGLLIGFLAGVYVAERRRRPHQQAWRSTFAAIRASGLALLVELAGALLAASAWLIGALTI
jgi:uncharacterized protein YqgC (DUF456 family)